MTNLRTSQQDDINAGFITTKKLNIIQ